MRTGSISVINLVHTQFSPPKEAASDMKVVGCLPSSQGDISSSMVALSVLAPVERPLCFQMLLNLEIACKSCLSNVAWSKIAYKSKPSKVA